MRHSILIVDDNLYIRRAIRSYLALNSDWMVCGEAENGAIAVQKVQQAHPCAVILDFQMPVMNGLDAAREIARCAPETIILMISVYDTVFLLPEAKAIGIKDVLSKSGNFLPELMARLRQLLPSSAA
jgi:DNA-binding NarL/FixJ family response regulator